MKLTKTTLLVGVMALAAVSAAGVSAAEEGVVTEENADSITGYTTTFTYVDEDATDVQIIGGFQFYEEGDLNVWANGFVLPANDTQANHLLGPDEWSPDLSLYHLNDTGYTGVMEQDEDGVWTISFDLPGGYYMYQYEVSYDGGENFEDITDPANVPECNEYGSHQTRSQFYVPYDEVQGNEDYYDWSWATPIEDESAQGTIEYVVYTGSLSDEQQMEIYLPANYDADREEPYKVLYLSHGGGGEEGDWFYQGHAANIVDRLIADGSCEEFLMVCMNNADYLIEGTRDWDFDKIYENIKEYIIPYIEENYNVSEEAEDRAFAGLSNGAKAGTMLYIMDPELFGYIGLFSGSAAWAWPELDDYSEMMTTNIYLAAGYGDQLMMQDTYHTDEDKTLMGLKELLDDAGITYNNGGTYVTVQGAHDWFTWPQILKDYVETTLWK